MKKILFSVVICLAFLLASAQASFVQAQTPDLEENLAKRFPEKPESWRHPHFNDIKDLEYISPTEESLRLTQEQVKDFSCSSVTDVPRNECETLVALYESTNGAGWLGNDNWLQSTSVNDWYGIIVYEGHVTEIDLLQNNLTGNLPATLGNLSNLKYLDFSSNQLTGPIPATLGNLV